MSNTDSFYRDLPAFQQFDEVRNPAHFRQAPADWVVLLTDIKGSTRAATEGRYKEVNMLGVSAIVLVANQQGDMNVACVFGGDGATILLPQRQFEALRPELAGLVHLARKQFGLELRVGAVPVGELLARGYPLLVGKFQVSPTTYLAQFIGTGLGEAETLIKRGDPRSIAIDTTHHPAPPQLQGLSCRLQPFKSRRGLILSFIVRPRTPNDAWWLRETLLPRIQTLLGDDWLQANPVSTNTLRWKWVPDTLSTELSLLGTGMLSYLIIAFKAIAADVLLKLNLSVGRFAPRKYKNEVAIQSDYKKLDDNLRMVIDCSHEQYANLLQLFEQAHKDGHIFYGTHTAEHAVVTCLTYSASSGQHVHFVDGEDCGYTRAAMQLKAQIQS